MLYHEYKYCEICGRKIPWLTGENKYIYCLDKYNRQLSDTETLSNSLEEYEAGEWQYIQDIIKELE